MPNAPALRHPDGGPPAGPAGAATRCVPLEHSVRLASKWAYTTRRIDCGRAQRLISGAVRPRAGDLVLAQVRQAQPAATLLLASGGSSALFEGDLVVVCYGDRDAPGGFAARIPEALAGCGLVSAGGIAACDAGGEVAAGASAWLEPLGLVADECGQRLNLRETALTLRPAERRTPVVAALDGALRAGPAAVAAPLVKGFTAAGLRTGVASIFASPSPSCERTLQQAGAGPVLGLTDAGICSTHRQDPVRIERALTALTGHLQQAAVDVIVLEVGLGLPHPEVATLVRSSCFKALVDLLLLSAPDVTSALVGVDWLRGHGFTLIGVTGPVADAADEAREIHDEANVRVLPDAQLSHPALAVSIVDTVTGAGRASATGRGGGV